jgi:hypothetical protein
MELPNSFEAEWSMRQNVKEIHQMAEQERLHRTARGDRKVQSRLRSVVSAIKIPSLDLRSLQPAKDRK